MEEEKNLPQDAEVQKAEQPGDTQVVEPKELEQPGAEEQPQAEQKVERTYSQDEWSKRESAKDIETQGLRDTLSQVTMQAQIAEQQRAEVAAQTKDQKDVEEGLITEAEVKQRQGDRQRTIQMQPRVEAMGRMMAAQDFGEKHGVDPYELLRDKDIKTPQQMEAKAKQLAQTKSDTEKQTVSDEIETLRAEIKALKEGEPQFDQGQQGAGSTNLEDLSPSELSAAAYSSTEVSRRAKKK